MYIVGTSSKRARRTKSLLKAQGEMNLRAEECLRLLRCYLPHHATRKISQMMFVKLVHGRM